MKARLALAVLLVVSINAVALSDTTTVQLIIPDVPKDSGWDAIFDSAVNVGIPVPVDDIVFDGNGGYVVIQIEPKTFRDFTPIAIRFQQRLVDAVRVIRIADESIMNLTGVEWTDFHWELRDPVDGVAVFDASDPGSFSVAPFTNKDLTLTALYADEPGAVPAGTLFSPGVGSGPLYIVTDPGQGLMSFTLIQYPTPEPGTMALLALGGVVVLWRKPRKA